MPVTTRSQKRKLEDAEHEAKRCKTENPFLYSSVNDENYVHNKQLLDSIPTIEYTMPSCEYMPCYLYHDLKNDKELQAQLYPNFEYDFANWPQSSKFIAKEYNGTFADFIKHLQLKQLMSWGHRMANTTHQIDMSFKASVFLPATFRFGYINFDIEGLQSGFFVSNVVELEKKLLKILNEVQVGVCTLPDEDNATDYYFVTDVTQVEIKHSKNYHSEPRLGPVLCYC
jgi:hypothetical protein